MTTTNPPDSPLESLHDGMGRLQKLLTNALSAKYRHRFVFASQVPAVGLRVELADGSAESLEGFIWAHETQGWELVSVTPYAGDDKFGAFAHMRLELRSDEDRISGFAWVTELEDRLGWPASKAAAGDGSDLRD
jgi:hypothetical protein